jgi:hypothetical protein
MWKKDSCFFYNSFVFHWPGATKAEVSGPTRPTYARILADSHPCSGRRDNSFMPRRPYAGVAPAQPGPTPVASNLSRCSPRLHHLRMTDLFSLGSYCERYLGRTESRNHKKRDANVFPRPAATTAKVSGPTRPPYARRLKSRISTRSGSRSNSIILRRPYLGVCDSIKNTRHFYFQFKFRLFSISFNHISIG